MSIPLLCPLALAGCGSGPPTPTSHGPRIEAVEAAQFTDAAAPARQAEFSPDGRLLATTSADGTVTLRQVPGHRVLRRMRHDGGAAGIAFASNGSWLATSGYDGTVRIWDPGSGRQVRKLSGAQGTLWTVHSSADSTRLAAAGEDKVIRIWDISTGRVLGELRGHERNIWEVRYSPDGGRIASASFDETVRIWDASTGTRLAVQTDHEEAVVGLSWSPDGKWLASSGDDSTIRIRRASDGGTARVIDAGNHAYKVAFSADSRWLASAGRARSGFGTLWYQLTGVGQAVETVRLWRVADGALVAGLKLADDAMYVAFSPSGQWLTTSGEDGRVHLWRLSARK